MKRKLCDHNELTKRGANSQSCDLILTDAVGRTIHVHKGLLIDTSDYFATLLRQNNLNAVHLDEKYLLEMIHYLYRYENEQRHSHASRSLDYRWDGQLNIEDMNRDPTIMNGDLLILMNLLIISEKYSFKQLHSYLLGEINCRISPSSVIQIYTLSCQLSLNQFKQQTKIMILTWLPQLIQTESFLQLPEEAIHDIFSCEPEDIDNEVKLNALSSWWSRNKQSDMTNLWMKLITCTHK